MFLSLIFVSSLFFFLSTISQTSAAPFPTQTAYLTPVAKDLERRQYVAGESVPYFPQEIPSCIACQPEWSGISSCAKAAPAFENWQNMIFNPAAFYNAIKCGCTDTFNSAYPQCVDCFVQTNQCAEFLGVPSEQNASSILDGLREVCGLGSVLIGNVAKSQTQAGLSYTYNGIPSQGYSISTTTGVGGLDYGSAQGGSSGASSVREGGKGIAKILFTSVLLVLFSQYV
ncbi:hypothetical protein JCM5353_006783 [Sporobolomyces roseus]